MRNGLIVLCLVVLAFTVGMPLLHGVLGLIGGLVIAPFAVVGALLLAGFILFLVFSGVGALGLVLLAVAGVVVLAVLLPLLLPLLIIALPIILLVKLVRG
jgi:hypothetical protein